MPSASKSPTSAMSPAWPNRKDLVRDTIAFRAHVPVPGAKDDEVRGAIAVDVTQKRLITRHASEVVRRVDDAVLVRACIPDAVAVEREVGDAVAVDIARDHRVRRNCRSARRRRGCCRRCNRERRRRTRGAGARARRATRSSATAAKLTPALIGAERRERCRGRPLRVASDDESPAGEVRRKRSAVAGCDDAGVVARGVRSQSRSPSARSSAPRATVHRRPSRCPRGSARTVPRPSHKSQ